MSTAASLAAAKKRRGPQFQQPSQGPNQSNKSNQLNQSNNKNQFETKVEILTDRQILTKHEKRIFNIESLLKALLDERKNTINGNYVTKEDLSNLSLEKDGNENKQEIEKLKRTITALSKSNAEMNLKLAQIKSNLQDSNNLKKKVSIHEDLNQNKDNQDDEDDEDDDDDDDDDEHEDGELEEKKEEIQLSIQ